ncbi:MAG: hypothetical protein ACP5PX_06665 [Candidatus Hadarchaeum sp.]|uniref:hypothetical protein n=1 Tax=Candidatus Hadarchaeum sp. TaxID=2883567 RepID=UPI003D12B5F3
MNKHGIGYTIDLLIFALLVSLSFTVLFTFSQPNAEISTKIYAMSFTRNALLALLNSTTDQFGGFSYQAGFQVPEISGQTPLYLALRNLGHKTMGELLAEDVLLNLQLKIGSRTVATIWSNEDMNNKLSFLLKSILDNLAGRKFGYRFVVKATPVKNNIVSFDFNLLIENLSPSGTKLCRETSLLSLPISNEELISLAENRLGFSLPQHLETNPVIEIGLELWSR